MNEDTRRILNAAIYALAAVVTILGTVGQPHDVLGWAGFVVTAFLTAYAKYSTSTKLVEPNRNIWTPEEREAHLKEGIIPRP